MSGGGGADLWYDLRQRCPKDQLKHFKILQEKHMEYIERVSKLPQGLPRIDWDYYRHSVADKYKNTVEEFKTAYENYKVPYPKADEVLKEIKSIQATVEGEVSNYKSKSSENVRNYQELIERAENHMPFDEMTWEDYQEIYPDRASNFLKNPTYWPHLPEDQLGYGPEPGDDHGHH